MSVVLQKGLQGELPTQQDKHRILAAMYKAYEGWLDGRRFYCHKGCALCCTQSVVATSLEAELIVNYLQEHQEWDSKVAIIRQQSEWVRPQLTTNQYARLCLEQESVADEISAGWNMAPCVFLKDGCCSIYPVRPFACRSFFSRISCQESGEAAIEPLLITANTVLLQLIEHLDQGRPWGNLMDILGYIHQQSNALQKVTESGQNQRILTVSQTLPGFLIPPEEQAAIDRLLALIFSLEIDSQTIGRVMGFE